MPYNYEYTIGNSKNQIITDETCFWGDDLCMLNSDVNLVQDCEWGEKGYVISPFLNDSEFEDFHKKLVELIQSIIKSVTGRQLENNDLSKYHLYVSNKDHVNIVKTCSSCFTLETLGIPASRIVDRVSEIVNKPLRAGNPDFPFEFPQYCLRIVRPNGVQDYNPPHKDVYLEHLRNAINVYVPLVGSTNESSIGIIPGSHYWNENTIKRTGMSPVINNVKFTVPCIVETSSVFSMDRPNPQMNEVLVFSPYLVHGGGVNWNKDQTRMSFEMRFWHS